jgi:hypothetical protein
MNGRLCVKISKNVMPSEYTSLAALYGPSPLPGELWRLYSHISGAMNSRVPQIVESPCLQESEDNQKGKKQESEGKNNKNQKGKPKKQSRMSLEQHSRRKRHTPALPRLPVQSRKQLLSAACCPPNQARPAPGQCCRT